MTVKAIPIPDQFDGVVECEGRVLLNMVFEFRIKAATEDEAYEKAEKLARLQLLEFDREPVDLRGMEVEFLSECKKKLEVRKP